MITLSPESKTASAMFMNAWFAPKLLGIMTALYVDSGLETTIDNNDQRSTRYMIMID